MFSSKREDNVHLYWPWRIIVKKKDTKNFVISRYIVLKTAKKCAKIQYARAHLLFYSLNLLFGDTVVAAASPSWFDKTPYCQIGQQLTHSKHCWTHHSDTTKEALTTPKHCKGPNNFCADTAFENYLMLLQRTLISSTVSFSLLSICDDQVYWYQAAQVSVPCL